MPLPPIDAFNTYVDKTSGGNPAVVTDVVSAQDLNRIKSRMSENRAQANAASNPPVINITDTSSPFTLLSSHAGHVIRVDTSAGPVEIVANASLYDATSGAAFVVDIEHVAGSSLSITGAGGLTLTSTGAETGIPALFLYVPLFGRLVVSSATRAYFASEFVTYEALLNIAAARVLNIDHTASPFTILPTHANIIIRVDAFVDPVEILADASLYDATTDRAFSCWIEVVDGDAGITLELTGGLNAEVGTLYSVPSTNGLNRLTIMSPTRADFYGTSVAFGNINTSVSLVTSAVTTARFVADNGLYPNVQAATTASRMLNASDAGDIIVSDGASGALVYTVPSSVFGSGGADRAFVCQIKVASVAGGALTFVGSGGVVLSYYGKNPGVTPYTAGDYLTVVLDSATTASVFCASPA
jgi:hypothetical protein